MNEPLGLLISMASLVTLIGFCVGNFLTMLIDRLPLVLGLLEADYEKPDDENKELKKIDLFPPLFFQRSICPACYKQLAWWHLIPVLSFLFLKGRCFFCAEKFLRSYFLIELFCGLGFLLCFIQFGLTEKTVAAMIFVMFALVLSSLDLKLMCLPDILTLGLVWLGLLFNLNQTFVLIQSAVIGAMVGYGILWLIYMGFKYLTGKEGLGFGDFKLMSALGAWFGWEALPGILILSGLLGLVLGLVWNYCHSKILWPVTREFPFGPAIAVAGIIELFYFYS